VLTAGLGGRADAIVFISAVTGNHLSPTDRTSLDVARRNVKLPPQYETIGTRFVRFEPIYALISISDSKIFRFANCVDCLSLGLQDPLRPTFSDAHTVEDYVFLCHGEVCRLTYPS